MFKFEYQNETWISGIRTLDSNSDANFIQFRRFSEFIKINLQNGIWIFIEIQPGRSTLIINLEVFKFEYRNETKISRIKILYFTSDANFIWIWRFSKFLRIFVSFFDRIIFLMKFIRSKYFIKNNQISHVVRNAVKLFIKSCR